MTRAGQPFGYRAIAEMLRYIEQARGVLPPPRRSTSRSSRRCCPSCAATTRRACAERWPRCWSCCWASRRATWGKAAAVEPEAVAAAPFPEAAEKVRRMLERLEVEGFTDFYG